MHRFAVCAFVPLVALGLSTPSAFAQPTTPIPPPSPGQPPISEPPPLPVPGPIVGDAGTGIGMVRVLPKSRPTDSIIDDPEWERTLPKHSLAEVGMGLAVARANSGAYLGQERAFAQASPSGVALDGQVPVLPGSLVQTALPDHPRPTSGGLRPPSSPLVELGALRGSAQARWDRQYGPCGQPIAESRISLAHLSAGPGPLLNVPDGMSAESTVHLVDVAGQRGKAVRSTSTMRVAAVHLLAGTPQQVRIDVLSEPTLTATSTGDPATSDVDYRAPVLRISQGGRELGVLDAAHPALDVPVDLGVLRMSVGRLSEDITGSEVRAEARLFDLRVLPHDLPGTPATLTEVSFGEQIAKAGAPSGVVCDLATPAAVPPGPPPPQNPTMKTPYHAVPLLGITALLLGGLMAYAGRKQAAHSWP